MRKRRAGGENRQNSLATAFISERSVLAAPVKGWGPCHGTARFVNASVEERAHGAPSPPRTAHCPLGPARRHRAHTGDGAAHLVLVLSLRPREARAQSLS